MFEEETSKILFFLEYREQQEHRDVLEEVCFHMENILHFTFFITTRGK